MVNAEATQAAAGEVMSPRRRSPVAAIEAFIGRLVEIPAALLVVAEIVTLFAGIVARYIVQKPLIWSDELASILFLWLAMLGSVVAFRRSEHMRMTVVVGAVKPATRAFLDVGRDLCRVRFPAFDRRPELSIRLRGKFHHDAGTANLQ